VLVTALVGCVVHSIRALMFSFKKYAETKGEIVKGRKHKDRASKMMTALSAFISKHVTHHP